MVVTYGGGKTAASRNDKYTGTDMIASMGMRMHTTAPAKDRRLGLATDWHVPTCWLGMGREVI